MRWKMIPVSCHLNSGDVYRIHMQAIRRVGLESHLTGFPDFVELASTKFRTREFHPPTPETKTWGSALRILSITEDEVAFAEIVPIGILHFEIDRIQPEGSLAGVLTRGAVHPWFFCKGIYSTPEFRAIYRQCFKRSQVYTPIQTSNVKLCTYYLPLFYNY